MFVILYLNLYKTCTQRELERGMRIGKIIGRGSDFSGQLFVVDMECKLRN